jgi:hypothetical protein
MRAASAVAALLLAVQGPGASACGYCVEDRIAAAYDHAVIVRSLERRHEVAFFAIEGPTAANPGLVREIQNALESTGGVDRGSARVSRDVTALSFAYDPARQKLGPILRALDKKLAARGLSISLLRVIS